MEQLLLANGNSACNGLAFLVITVTGNGFALWLQTLRTRPKKKGGFSEAEI
jgi:hypothetical protein